jgi:hypothetical protein
MMGAMKLANLLPVCLALSATLFFAARAPAAPVRQVELRIVIGAEQLTAGSDLELRIYESNGVVRRLPVAHEDSWLPDSTHLIPLKLDESLEPRNVQRFAIYYRPSSALAAPFEIIAADVELPSVNGEPERLLGQTLSGVIARQGELATENHALAGGTCASDAECDDHRACNGRERCAPHAAKADARGCVRGEPVVCPVNQICGEGIGCHGLATPKPVARPVERDSAAAEPQTPPSGAN